MSAIEVVGGNKLYGRLKVQGSKNAVLPILAACILCQDVIKLKKCPKISDVLHTVKILEHLGCNITWDDEALFIDARTIVSNKVPEEYVRIMRSSIIFAGSVIGRCGEVSIAYPGGCAIGARPIDLHLKAFKKMNIQITEENGRIDLIGKDIKGEKIFLDFPSVGATENIILTSVLANGDTYINGAAKEPEIIELCKFLQVLGAKIRGEGTDVIHITGVKKLHGCEYTICADRIVVGTYLTALAGCGGSIRLEEVDSSHLNATILALEEMGVKFDIGTNYIDASMEQSIYPVDVIRTSPYPGFPTDMQSQFMAVLTKANGTSVIIENIFEARYKCVGELSKMGAHIITEGKVAVVKGVDTLYGAEIKASDLRGGAALVIAALMAKGKSLVTGTEYIKRGYIDICADLRKLGADIKYV